MIWYLKALKVLWSVKVSYWTSLSRLVEHLVQLGFVYVINRTFCVHFPFLLSVEKLFSLGLQVFGDRESFVLRLALKFIQCIFKLVSIGLNCLKLVSAFVSDPEELRWALAIQRDEMALTTVYRLVLVFLQNTLNCATSWRDDYLTHERRLRVPEAPSFFYLIFSRLRE